MESNAILNVVKEGLVIDLSRHAIGLRHKYGECFIPPAPGIYITTSIASAPVIYPGMKYYSRSSFETKTPLSSIAGVVEDILGEDGSVIIPSWVLKESKRFIRDNPIVPVREMDTAELIVRDYVDSMLAFNEPEDRLEKYERLLKPEFIHLYTEGYLEAACRDLINIVANFIGCDNWNMYDFKRHRSDLTIMKGEDWRIYDWTLQKELQAEEKLRTERGE